MKITEYTLTWQESQLALQTPFKVLHVRVLPGNGAALSILEMGVPTLVRFERYNFYIAIDGEELPRLMEHVGSDVNPNAGFPTIHVFMEQAR